MPYVLSAIPEFNAIVHNLEMNNECCTSKLLKINKHGDYSIVRYDKSLLSFDLVSTYGLCRSIIVNSGGKVVCFSPPKSIPSDIFIKQYSETTDEIIAEEFVEGTMVNVFWDPTIGITGSWEISTKNTIGAASSFYKGTKHKSFREMFLEAALKNNLMLNLLHPNYCYSFVLQHPENRIVVPFKKPQLYLVAMYSIQYVGKNIEVCGYNPRELLAANFEANHVSVKFPIIYKWSSYSDLIENYASMNTSYNIVGVMLHNRVTGERAKIRNPVYEQVRCLRGNQPKLQYQYLCLRKEGKVSDFLKFYPENKKDFSGFRDQVHLFTNTLFENYRACYVKKEKPLKEFSDQYRTHMFKIHQIYMSDLREKQHFVTNKIVQKYVNELAPSLLMYCLNYSMRKQNIDTIPLFPLF